MLNTFKSLAVLLLLYFSYSAYSAVIMLKGVYQGKNLYVQNPPAKTGDGYCTSQVLLNGQKVLSKINSSAYEIDLSDLKENQPVEIKIYHEETCKPKVLNPNVITVVHKFEFSSLNIEGDYIVWAGKGVVQNAKFVIERFQYGTWTALGEHLVPASLPQVYQHKFYLNSGSNLLRIKYSDGKGKIFYSDVMEHVSTLPEVTFYPQRVTDKVYLSRDAEYELLDVSGDLLEKGYGKEIDLTKHPMGVYYVNTDNKTFKIFKK